jgi:hypothetical protein
MRINKIKEEQTDAENILVIIKKEIVGNVELGKKARGSHIQLGMDKVKDVRSYQKPLYLYDLLELNDKNKSMIKMIVYATLDFEIKESITRNNVEMYYT